MSSTTAGLPEEDVGFIQPPVQDFPHTPDGRDRALALEARFGEFTPDEMYSFADIIVHFGLHGIDMRYLSKNFRVEMCYAVVTWWIQEHSGPDDSTWQTLAQTSKATGLHPSRIHAALKRAEERVVVRAAPAVEHLVDLGTVRDALPPVAVVRTRTRPSGAEYPAHVWVYPGPDRPWLYREYLNRCHRQTRGSIANELWLANLVTKRLGDYACDPTDYKSILGCHLAVQAARPPKNDDHSGSDWDGEPERGWH